MRRYKELFTCCVSKVSIFTKHASLYICSLAPVSLFIDKGLQVFNHALVKLFIK